MEGRGGTGVRNIQRQMNYPLPSGAGGPIGANNSSKKKLKKPERQENEMLQRKGALKSIYRGV